MAESNISGKLQKTTMAKERKIGIYVMFTKLYAFPKKVQRIRQICHFSRRSKS